VSHKKAKVLIAMLCEAIKLLKKKYLNFPLITDLGKIEEIFLNYWGVVEASKMLFFNFF